ncbi:hypothetical protein Tco_0717162, partial [Tanacetum coccineum]
ISAGKEVDIGGGSLPLTQSGMADFMPGRAVIDAAQRKRGKYTAKCAGIEYGFLPFSFSSLGELEANAVSLLKRIRKDSMAQDIGARADIHIFNRISFAIAKGILMTGHRSKSGSLGFFRFSSPLRSKLCWRECSSYLGGLSGTLGIGSFLKNLLQDVRKFLML